MKMADPRLIITKEKENKSTSAVFVDVELLDQVKLLKQETGWSIQKIVEQFIRYGIENVEIVEE